MTALLKPLRLLAKALAALDSPRQLAAGSAALGAGDARLKAVQDSLAKRLKSPLPVPGGFDRLFR